MGSQVHTMFPWQAVESGDSGELKTVRIDALPAMRLRRRQRFFGMPGGKSKE
jgi:hypothetical protein